MGILMQRIEVVILGKAIRDTFMAPTARALLITNICNYMKQQYPNFKEQILKDVVVNADYKDRLVNHLVKDIK